MEDYRAIGTFLVFTADKKETLSNSEYSKTVREVDDVAIGRYEQVQKRGNSICCTSCGNGFCGFILTEYDSKGNEKDCDELRPCERKFWRLSLKRKLRQERY